MGHSRRRLCGDHRIRQLRKGVDGARAAVRSADVARIGPGAARREVAIQLQRGDRATRIGRASTQRQAQCVAGAGNGARSVDAQRDVRAVDGAAGRSVCARHTGKRAQRLARSGAGDVKPAVLQTGITAGRRTGGVRTGNVASSRDRNRIGRGAADKTVVRPDRAGKPSLSH